MFLSTGTLSICLQTAYLKSNATWTDGWVMGDGMNYDTMNPSRFRNIPRIIISCLWCAWQGKPKQGCVVPHTLTYSKNKNKKGKKKTGHVANIYRHCIDFLFFVPRSTNDSSPAEALQDSFGPTSLAHWHGLSQPDSSTWQNDTRH